MIYVGLDDTDTLDDPGTNQLARHLVRELAGHYTGRIIIRHQLLEDPRVPCTKKNGCASLLFERVEKRKRGQNDFFTTGSTKPAPANRENSSDPFVLDGTTELIAALREVIIPWCPAASDPGLCVTECVPTAVVDWGRRCQRELVTQSEARELAAEHGIHLEGLGGTEDGVIGALAAVGLMATRNDGRVVHYGRAGEDWYDVTGSLAVDEILDRGVDAVCDVESGSTVDSGTVDVGKRLRPNYRDGRIVLYATRREADAWDAVRVT